MWIFARATGYESEGYLEGDDWRHQWPDGRRRRAGAAELPRRLLEVRSGEESPAGLMIQQPRDRQAVAGLVGPHRRLGLGRIEAVNRARVEAEVVQMRLGDLDLPARQDPVHRGALEPGRGGPGLRRHAGGQEQ